MIAHLEIEANGKPLSLPQGFQLDIEDANPLFNDNEMYTFPVNIPLEGNRHLVQNVEDIHSDIRLVSLEHTPMRIKVDGVPYRSGVAVIDESQEIEDGLSFSIKSMKESLDDRISDLECRDVPVKDRIQIGEMIGDVEVTFQYDYWIYTKWKEIPPWVIKPSKTGKYMESVKQVVPLQALGFSYPFIAEEIKDFAASPHRAKTNATGQPIIEKSFINVSDPYPVSQYCNTRVCYKHYAKSSDDNSGDETDFSGKYGPIYVLEADRPQSGICFYVLYFLDCLFSYLGVSYNMESLKKVADLNRLFFFNTKCAYDLERKYSGAFDLDSIHKINEWISSRAMNVGHKGKLEIYEEEGKDVNSIVINGVNFVDGKTTKIPEGAQGFWKTEMTLNGCAIVKKDWEYSVKANIMKMYANSDNFPESSVPSIIDSLWNSFGVKFLVNYETGAVRAVLIRDIYRDLSSPIIFPCEVIKIVKVTEKVTGVKMIYSSESDEKEQRKNIKHGVKDYDTNFDYIDYRNVNRSLPYEEILKRRSCTDMTTYVDENTGNAYRLKVDSEATTIDEMNARLFEVGGYKGVSIGDCSPLNEDFVTELNIDWSPMLFTDVNIINEMSVGAKKDQSCTDEEGHPVTVNGINGSLREQIFAAFIEDEMWHENTEFHIDNVVSGGHCEAALREVLTTDEAYDPSSTEDGNSPLQHADWGCAVGIMRGGGTDATLESYDYNYDGFGNSKWRMVSGSYDVSSDSIDNWGTAFDYNGSAGGIGDGERISLKIRSYKNDPETGEAMCINNPEVKNRGLFDTFMSEHAHFLLNRKKYKITCQCEIAALADIPNHWEKRYNVGGIVGWINKISSSVSLEEGLGLVEIEMYSL